MAVNATAVWRVRPSGSNTNGGGYDPGISGAGTDYSQQNAAQASGTNGVTTGTTTFTDATANAFTSAMVGNAMYITGTGQTTDWYFVTGFTSSSVVTLDRSPGTGTGATWNLGGGWGGAVGTPFNNLTSAGPTVNDNIAYILGSGIPNPSSYTFDYTFTSTFTIANSNLTIANDPATPGYKAWPDTTGAMPCVKWNLNGPAITNSGEVNYQGLWFVAGSSTTSGTKCIDVTNQAQLKGCVFDQFGLDVCFALAETGEWLFAYGCEVFSSVVPGSAGSSQALGSTGNGYFLASGCNIHDVVGLGISLGGGTGQTIFNCIVAKCGSDGIKLATGNPHNLLNNTIDANGGNGINETSGTAQTGATILNNIISNHTAAGTFGIKFGSTNASNTTVMVDYNVFFNNTSDLHNQSYGPHDTHGGSNPYAGQSTENYTLA